VDQSEVSYNSATVGRLAGDERTYESAGPGHPRTMQENPSADGPRRPHLQSQALKTHLTPRF